MEIGRLTHLLQKKTAMDMLPSKASEGDFIRNGLVSEDFTLSEFLFRQGMMLPNRLKVRPEPFPKSMPMSVWSKFCTISGLRLRLKGCETRGSAVINPNEKEEEK
jgi:hypothetical protein